MLQIDELTRGLNESAIHFLPQNVLKRYGCQVFGMKDENWIQKISSKSLPSFDWTMMNREILRLAIPNIIANISVPMLGIDDTALVGHMEADYYIGALAVGTMVFNLLYFYTNFFTNFTSI